MMKYICQKCGEPTDNDQSIDVKSMFGGFEPYHLDVHRCDKCDKRFHQELDWESEGETINKDKLICPYCECEYDDYDTYSFDEGDTSEVECDFCGKKFDLKVETRRVFSTKRSLCEMPENYGEEDEE